MRDHELISGVPLLLIYLVVCCACAALLLGGCAHVPTGHSEHWNACVKACGEGGGSVVAAVEVADGPGCVCQKPKEAT